MIYGAIVWLCVLHKHAQQVIIVSAGSVLDHRLDVLVTPSLLACHAPELRQQVERVAVESNEVELYLLIQV